MGSHAGRVRRALLAWLASAAMLFASAGPLVSGHAAIDKECAPGVFKAHDQAAHRLREAPDAGPDHCAACHLTRTVRNASGVSALLQHALILETGARAAHEPAARIDLRTDFTRGPPSALSLS